MRRIDVILSGASRPGDVDNSWEVLPEWFNREKFDRGRRLLHGNAFSNYFSTNIGVVMMSQVPSLMEPLINTGNVCTISKSQTRVAHTFQFVLSWHVGDIFDPEDQAYKNLKKVKNMHKKVADRMNKTRPSTHVWVSQLDMALTQFSIIGAIMLFPKKIGIFLSDEELELIAHFWKTIGYLLGMEDEYNLCTGTYGEIHELCWDIVEVIAKPALSNPNPIYSECLNNSMTGLKKFSTLIDRAAFCNWTYELIGFPKRETVTVFGKVCLASWVLTVRLLRYDQFRQYGTKVLRSRVNKKINKHIESVEANRRGVVSGVWDFLYSCATTLVVGFKKLVVPNGLHES